MLIGHAGELSFVLGKTGIVDDHFGLAGLPHSLGVEVERDHHNSLKEIEDGHSSVSLNGHDEDSGMAKGKIDDRTRKF